MSTQHKRPLIAFVTVVVLCVLLLGHAVRSEALDSSSPPSPVAGDRLRVGDRVVDDLPEETASTPPTATVDSDPAVAEPPLAATAGSLGPIAARGPAPDPSITPRRSDGKGDPPATQPTTSDEPRSTAPTPGASPSPPTDPTAAASNGPDEDAPKGPSQPTEPTPPLPTEPTPTEPTPTEPTPTGPVQTGPEQTGPVQTAPSPTAPSPSHLNPVEPNSTEPGPAAEPNEQPAPTASATPSFEDLDPIIP